MLRKRHLQILENRFLNTILKYSLRKSRGKREFATRNGSALASNFPFDTNISKKFTHNLRARSNLRLVRFAFRALRLPTAWFLFIHVSYVFEGLSVTLICWLQLGHLAPFEQLLCTTDNFITHTTHNECSQLSRRTGASGGSRTSCTV